MEQTEGLTPHESLKQLTQRYARFSRSAGGLGTALGGALALAAFIAARYATLPWAARCGLATAPFLWVASKELLRRSFYQRYGRVTESLSRGAKRLHGVLSGFTTFLVLAIFVLVVPKWAQAPSWQGAAYLSLLAALSVCSWLFLWTPEEFILGVFLFIQAAIALAGG